MRLQDGARRQRQGAGAMCARADAPQQLRQCFWHVPRVSPRAGFVDHNIATMSTPAERRLWLWWAIGVVYRIITVAGLYHPAYRIWPLRPRLENPVNGRRCGIAMTGSWLECESWNRSNGEG